MGEYAQAFSTVVEALALCYLLITVHDINSKLRHMCYFVDTIAYPTMKQYYHRDFVKDANSESD